MRIEILNATDANGKSKNVFIEGGKIVAVLSAAAETSLDAKGLTIAPAFIDPHAHLRVPGQTAKENLQTGLSAAVAGGFGSVVCMPNTNPVLDEPEQISTLIAQAESLGLARLLPSAALTRKQEGKLLTDAAALKKSGAVMLTDDGRTNEDAGVLRRALEYATALGLTVSVHSEDASLRGDGVMNEGAVSERLGLPGNPALAESARIARDIEIAIQTGGRLHVQHLSTARGLELVRQAKKIGHKNITCEVTPHHLTLSDDAFESADFFCDPILKVAPPLRTQSDIAALLAGIQDGTVDCIGTDHAPHTQAEKQRDMLEAPFGIANIEIAFPLLYTQFVEPGKISLAKLIALMTEGPTNVLGLATPSLEIGQAADIVLLDLKTERAVNPAQFFTKANFASPWAGQNLRGWPHTTIVRGKIVFQK